MQKLRQLFHIMPLSDVSFTIGDGEMVGYIGPNGAGKSSTIKILSGILTPESGSCLVDGRIPWKDRKEHVRQIGVVFGQRSQLWWEALPYYAGIQREKSNRYPSGVQKNQSPEHPTTAGMKR